MRDLALTGLFAWAIWHTLRQPWIGVLLWTWFSIMNPHRMTYGFAYLMPFAAMAAGATMLSMLIHRDQVRLPPDAAVRTLIAFSLWMCITTLFGFYPEGSLPDLDRALKVLLMTLVATALIRERKHIEAFVWINVVSLAWYGLKGGLFTILSGGSSRVWGPAGSFIEGNNEIGLALIVSIPLMNYLRLVSPKKWVRMALMGTMLLSGAAALGTQSRGAFLALVAMGALLWWRSRQRIVGGIFIGIFAVLLLAFMPDSWSERMRTIETYSTDQSAQGRLSAWTVAFRIANDRFTGGGFLVEKADVWNQYLSVYDIVLTAHSIYFQALGEHGWIGLFMFLLLGGLSFGYAGRVRKQGLARPETLWLYDLGGMLQVSMVGFAVGGAFLSLTYFDLPYNLLVIAVACRWWLLDKRYEVEKAGLFGSTVPVGARAANPGSAAMPAGWAR